MSSKDYIFIKKSKGVYVKVFHKDITHIQSDKDYCKIFTDKKTFLVHVRLHNIITYLPPDIFHQCHRSYIVNVDRVEEIEDETIFINGIFISVSNDYRKELLEKLNYVPVTYQGKSEDKKAITHNVDEYD